MIGGMPPRSAALAEAKGAASPPPANKATVRLRMTPSSRTSGPKGRPDTETMGRESQLIFKRRLTLKLNPDFSLTDFVDACAMLRARQAAELQALTKRARSLTRAADLRIRLRRRTLVCARRALRAR